MPKRRVSLVLASFICSLCPIRCECGGGADTSVVFNPDRAGPARSPLLPPPPLGGPQVRLTGSTGAGAFGRGAPVLPVSRTCSPPVTTGGRRARTRNGRRRTRCVQKRGRVGHWTGCLACFTPRP
eukprot:gene16176-biopygen17233